MAIYDFEFIVETELGTEIIFDVKFVPDDEGDIEIIEILLNGVDVTTALNVPCSEIIDRIMEAWRAGDWL